MLYRLAAAILCANLLALPTRADDSGLKDVARTLAVVRTTHGANDERDAGPELTPVKQALHSWVEQRLATLPTDMPDGPDADRLTALSKQMYAALTTADLTCEAPKPGDYRCVDKDPDTSQFNARGYVGRVALSYLDRGRYLLVETSVGIRCGMDESAYVYEARDERWRLLIQAEQNNYDKNYSPQNFLSVAVSPSSGDEAARKASPLVLTLGYSPWCSSNWQGIYTRLWRTSPADPSPKPLIDTRDTLYMGDDGVAAANLTDHDVLIQFRGRSIDGDTLVRPIVRHYQVLDRDRIERVAPVALSPADFVDEWLSRDWTDSLKWSDPAGHASTLAQWHQSMHRHFLFGEFDGQPTRCQADPTLWQVGFTLSKGLDDDPHPEIVAHFLVRWMAPYSFTMVDVRSDKFPSCDQVVDQPDDLGTLFPVDDWRR